LKTDNIVVFKLGEWIGTNHLNRQLADRPDLRDLLLPDYKFACKRLCPSNEFYPALARSNVTVIRDPVAEVRDHSIITSDQKEYKIDVKLRIYLKFEASLKHS